MIVMPGRREQEKRALKRASKSCALLSTCFKNIEAKQQRPCETSTQALELDVEVSADESLLETELDTTSQHELEAQASHDPAKKQGIETQLQGAACAETSADELLSATQLDASSDASVAGTYTRDPSLTVSPIKRFKLQVVTERPELLDSGILTQEQCSANTDTDESMNAPHSVDPSFILNATLSDQDRVLFLQSGWTAPSDFVFAQEGGRRYKPEWEKRYNWLRYSAHKNKVFCGPCLIFDNTRCNKFSATGYDDWKNATGHKRSSFHIHDQSKTHISCMSTAISLLEISQGVTSNIKQHISQAYADNVKRNREIMTSIVDVILQLGSRGIALRGSWIKYEEGEEKRITGSENGYEDGNFNSFVEWKSHFDAVLMRHLKHHHGRAKYLSPETQNQLIVHIGDEIRDKIIAEANKADFFSIMADETADVANQEQMSLCVRFIKMEGEKPVVMEEHMGFVEVDKTDAETLTKGMVNNLDKWGLDLGKWRGKGFDGASNMSGAISGVQERITKLFPKAKYFTHCSNHRLNLVVVATCRDVPIIRNFMDTFQQLSLFLNASTKRKTIMKKVFKDEETVNHLLADLEEEDVGRLFQASETKMFLPTLCTTRWLSRVDSISVLLSHYKAVYDSLLEINNASIGQAARDADSYINAISQFSFVVAAVISAYVLAFIRPLSVALQSKQCDLLKANADARNLVETLQRVRSDETAYNRLYERCLSVAALIHVEESKPRTAGRQKHRANAPADSPRSYYKINFFNLFLDHVIAHLNERFPADQDMYVGFLLIPSRVKEVGEEQVEHIMSQYGSDMPYPGDFKQELLRWKVKNDHETTFQQGLSAALEKCDNSYFPNISTILLLLLTLPVGSCSCERSFSSLRRLKTWARTAMTEQRLNGLAMMYIHRHNPADITNVLRRWKNSGKHNIDLGFI